MTFKIKTSSTAEEKEVMFDFNVATDTPEGVANEFI